MKKIQNKAKQCIKKDGIEMTHLKIVLFILIAFLIENQLFASGNEACLEKLLEEGTNSSLNLECSEELLSDESDDDENVFDEDVLPDYFAQRRLFQSHWGFVQTDCNQVPEDWENGFYQNKNKIIYHIASQGEEIQKRPFSEIPVEDMFVIADLIENKVVFYQWFNNLMQEKMKDMSYLSEKFLNKKMPTSWKKHFYLGGLIKYYIYNHHLLDLLAKNAKDSFTEITRPLYREEKGFVKLIDHPTTALSDIRNILRKIELNLKEDVDLQKCYLKKHDHKPCSKKCLHHYFSKIKNGDLYYYYNLSFGRFCLLQEIFGVDFIKNLTDQIVLWTSQKPEETKQVEVDELIKSIKSDKVKTPKNQNQKR
jgi:hypothetical protein